MTMVTGSSSWWRATLALCLGSFLVFINLYLPQPLLPLLRDLHGISTLEANALMSVATLAVAMALLVFGPLSDAVGRERIMRLTLLMAGALSMGMALVSHFEVLLLLRLIQGAVLGGLPAVAIAWMGDEFDAQGLVRAVGWYIAANSLGGISGRLMGGGIAEWAGPQAAFLVVGILTLGGALVFWRLLPRGRRFTPAPFRLVQARQDMWRHLKTPPLIAAYLLGGINFLVFINQYSYITFRLSATPYQLAAASLGLVFLTYLGGTLSSLLSGRLARRLTPAGGMLAGVVIMMAGTAVTGLASLGWILTGLLINAFGFFLAHSLASSWVGRHAQGARGSASALYLVFYYLGASLGGFWLEGFWQWQAWPGVMLGSWMLFTVTLSVALWMCRVERRPPG